MDHSNRIRKFPKTTLTSLCGPHVMSGDDSIHGTVRNGFPEQMDEMLSISSWLIVVGILTPIEMYVLLSFCISIFAQSPEMEFPLNLKAVVLSILDPKEQSIYCKTKTNHVILISDRLIDIFFTWMVPVGSQVGLEDPIAAF